MTFDISWGKCWFCGLGIAISNIIFLSVNCVQAQVPIPDSTLPNNSTVTRNGSIINITGGTQAGGNLFHSFHEFSVPTGHEAFFQNAVDIRNIITRVTGGSKSDIDGTIRTQGTANLFLINPNGIIFRANARLNVGGSFIGSTAKSINFADGTFFSATPTDTQPLLTVSAPLGLQFGSHPREIRVLGQGHKFNYDEVTAPGPRPQLETSVEGLAVKSGQTLALVGGTVSVEGGVLKAPAGRIEIGSVDGSQTVNLVPVQQAWTLGYPNTSSFGDIQFFGKSFLSTTGVGGGSIAIAAKTINLTEESILVGDTLGAIDGSKTRISGETINVNKSLVSNNTYNLGKGGDIELDANNITFNNNAGLSVQTQGKGDGGTINIVGKNSLLINGGAISSSAQGNSTGKAGDVNINVTGGSVEVRNIGITADNSSTGGKAGNINITANSLTLETGGVSADTTNTGKGGDININIAGSVKVKSAGINTDTSGTAEGGKINITANSLQLESASISSSTKGVNSTGKAGDITIKVPGQLTINQAAINTDTSGTGDAGKIDIDAGSIEFGGMLNTNTSGKGKAGTINIKANSFLLKEGGEIKSSTGANSTGNAGDITVKVTGPLTIKAPINTDTSGTGDAGKINISANSFQIQSGANITSSTTGVNSTGKAGEINIDAGSVEIGFGSGLKTNTSDKGNAGTIKIQANSFLLRGGSIKSTTDNNSAGNAGDITVNVTGPLTIDSAEGISTDTFDTGNAGKINMTANSFEITSTGINSRADQNSTGDAGDITVKVTGSLTIDKAAINTKAEGVGNAGQITITAQSMKLDNAINGPSIDATSTSGKGGNINLEIGNLLLLRRQGSISTTAGNKNTGGDGGNITINAPNGFIAAIPTENSNITANAFSGRGGEITINASGVYGIERRSQPTPLSNITAFSQRGINGKISINRPDVEQHLELPKLPRVFADRPPVNTSCSAIATTVSDTNSNTQQSQFIVTGRGGLPPNPYDTLSSEAVWSDNRLPHDVSQHQRQEKPKAKSPSKTTVVEINPATGWVFKGNGKVTLISQHKNANGLQPTPLTCQNNS